ncbi:MAG TPA: hypothetical protein VHC70_07525 [Phycisphaerales bacterium]|nr:hypothetical protein [Phycisphaerales bacterium]
MLRRVHTMLRQVEVMLRRVERVLCRVHLMLFQVEEMLHQLDPEEHPRASSGVIWAGVRVEMRRCALRGAWFWCASLPRPSRRELY